jgi:hypothetical protein
MPGCANAIKTVVVIGVEGQHQRFVTRLISFPFSRLGNGPSALTLSYLLSGNVPFYLGGCEDVALHTRLSHDSHEPLVTQDLQQLATVGPSIVCTC